MEREHLDVLVIGAGLSGIAAGHYLATRCPHKSIAILEARASLGGTWDLFRYPGIRSDSDMYTLCYSFRPWRDPKAIAEGPAILEYLRETAAESGIDRRIRYHMRVESARWSTERNLWTVSARNAQTGRVETFTCGFLWACTGYYRYDQGHAPAFPGADRFRGAIVHPQRWSEEIVHAGKRVVIIGSGATAMTLAPAMARTAAHVTILQRSPSYVISRPSVDRIARWLQARLPARPAYALARWKNVLLTLYVYQMCRRRPERARRYLLDRVRDALGERFDETHFTPRYAPWDQRLCLIPDGDLFDAINAGRLAIETDHIETFTERGIRLRSGRELEADLVVTATGLELQLLGGALLEVDGRRFVPSEAMLYRGSMFSDVPNFAFCVGYTNASWTLRAELACDYVTRLLRFMDERGYSRACPRPHGVASTGEPILGLSAGYIRRGAGQLPTQGASGPWRTNQNYILDRLAMGRGRIDDGILELSPRRGVDRGRGGRRQGERAA